MINRIVAGCCVASAILLSASIASAQMNNRPFSFGSVVGGAPAGTPSSGMSFAGRQAIINEKLYNSRPRNLLVGPDGDLVTVERGPGHTAIVTDASGAPIPQFRGSFAARGSFMSGFILGSATRFGNPSTLIPGARTGLAINGWIAMISSRGGGGAGGASSTGAAIDGWTLQVFGG